MRSLLLATLFLLPACRSTPDCVEWATDVAVFGAGCFWCSEAAFEHVDGVLVVTSGFMGGGDADPNSADALIEAGHVEVARVEYDPQRVSYEELLEWYWRIHDPTSVNKQGEDEGPEYRSVIFVNGFEQQVLAETSREQAGRRFDRPIVTTIEAADRFYPAAEKHQDYWQRNKNGEYCERVITPHLEAAGVITPR